MQCWWLKTRVNFLNIVGIPFVITNYFCGNKSVFAKPSMYVEYYFGRLPCKNRTASGDFLSAKMHSTEKSVFLDDFLQTRRMLYWTACYCASLLFLRRQIGYLCVKQPATYGIQFWLFAFNYLDLPLVKMLCTLKPYLLCRFW